MALQKIIDVLEDGKAVSISFTGDNTIGSKRLYTKFTAELVEGNTIKDSFDAVDTMKDDFKGII